MKTQINISESELCDIVADTIAEEVNQEMINEGRQFVNEMAKINVKDIGTSLFPANAYNIIVQGDNSPHKPAHVHVKNPQEGYSIRVYIETGELMSVENFGKRKRTDNFSDVLKSLAKWFEMPSTLFSGSSNREVALKLWIASNPI